MLIFFTNPFFLVSRFSLCTLLIISILLPLTIVYAVAMMIDVQNSRKKALQNVRIQLSDLVSKRAALIDIHFSVAAQIPKILATSLTVTPAQTEEDVDTLIREVLKKFPRPIGACIAYEPNVFREGIERFAPYVYRKFPRSEELLSADLALTYENDYTTWGWYRIPNETDSPVWSEPYFGEGGGNVPMCTYSVPFYHDGRFAGVVAVDISLEDIEDSLLQFAMPEIRNYLLSADGTYVAESDPRLDLTMKENIFNLAEKYQNEELAEAGRNMLQGKSDILALDRGFENQRVWIAYAPLPVTGWTLKVALDETYVLEPVYAAVYHTVVLFLAQFAVILTIIIIVARQLTVPIKRLAVFARKLAGGDLTVRMGGSRFSKEIDQLANTFDQMVIDLKFNIEQRIKVETTQNILEGELKAARSIQASLLPHVFPPFPERKELDIYAMNEPVAFIAGDFFDFFFVEPDTLAFVIADVSGHGVPAALFMAVSRTIIRTFSTPDRCPHEIIEQVNRVLCEENEDLMFVTLFYGHYNVQTGELTYVNAGHDRPYIVRTDGHLEALASTGPLVAIFKDTSYEEQTVHLEANDLFLAFTDGVTEAQLNENAVMYGVERLERLLRKCRGESVEAICDRIYRDVDAFSGHVCQDDVTLFALRRNEAQN